MSKLASESMKHRTGRSEARRKGTMQGGFDETLPRQYGNAGGLPSGMKGPGGQSFVPKGKYQDSNEGAPRGKPLSRPTPMPVKNVRGR